jgi:hypothetical protein
MGLEPRVEVRDISLSLVQGVVGAMIGRFVSMGIVLIASLLLAGCYRDFGPVVAEPDPPPPPLVVTFIQTGDRLTVTVYNEPLLTGVYDVTPSACSRLVLSCSIQQNQSLIG